MSSQALNLEAIYNAIDQHARNCPFPAIEIRANPFEVERLGWEQIRGIPVIGDEELGTGRFKIVCAQGRKEFGAEGTETADVPDQVIEPSQIPVSAPQSRRTTTRPIRTGG